MAKPKSKLFDVIRQDPDGRMYRVGACLTKSEAEDYVDLMTPEPYALTIIPHHNPKPETEG